MEEEYYPQTSFLEAVQEVDQEGSCTQNLEDIMHAIKYLVEKAKMEIPPGYVKNRAEAYWIPQIEMALNEDHGWCGRSMGTMLQTIEELMEYEEEEEE